MLRTGDQAWVCAGDSGNDAAWSQGNSGERMFLQSVAEHQSCALGISDRAFILLFALSHSLIAHLSGINGSGYHIGTQPFMPCLKAMFAKQRDCSKPDDDAGVVNCQCH